MKQYIHIAKIIVLLVVAPAVIYCASISESVRTWHEYRALDRECTSGNAGTSERKAPSGAPLLSTGALLGLMMPACDSAGVSVISYSPDKPDKADGMGLYRAYLTLSGEFRPLLAVIDSISDVPQIKTMSADFICDGRMLKEKRIQVKIVLMQLERNDYDDGDARK